MDSTERITVTYDDVVKEMTREEFLVYLDSLNVEELSLVIDSHRDIDIFWNVGLDERERLQAENITPTKNIRIPVTIINPYTQEGKMYTYKLDNFPTKFNVPVSATWAAYLAKYSFYTLGKFLFVEKNKTRYYIGNLNRAAKKITPKKKPRNASKKFFK